jgi:hypothetical protein
LEGAILMAEEVQFNAPIIITTNTYDDFKKYVDGRLKSIPIQHYLFQDGTTLVYCYDGGTVYKFTIYPYDSDYGIISKAQNNANYTDFNNNWINKSNNTTIENVIINNYHPFRYGTVRSTTKRFTATTAVSTNPTLLPISFPYPVLIQCGYSYFGWAEFDVDDTFDVELMPPSDGLVGVVTEAASSGQPVVKVDSTAIAAFVPGDKLYLGAEDYKYTVKDSNYTDTLTLTEDLNVAKSVSDTVKARYCYMDNVKAKANTIQHFGKEVPEPAYIRANWTFNITYNHKTDPTSVFGMDFFMVCHIGRCDAC